jgi:hypothetical protein
MLGCSISHSHRQSKNVVFLTPRLPCFILCRLTFPSSDETGCRPNLEVSESTLYSFECFCICTVLYYVIYFHTYECAVYTVCTVRVWSTATAKLHLVHVVFVFIHIWLDDWNYSIWLCPCMCDTSCIHTNIYWNLGYRQSPYINIFSFEVYQRHHTQ